MAEWVPRPWRRAHRGRSVVRVRRHILELWVRVRCWMAASTAQTGAEYLGLLLVVAAIIAALVATGPGPAIGDKLTDLVRDISGGE
jgi:hypothetical protein